jgi:sphingomyelin phosphodiesterase acid-like 3
MAWLPSAAPFSSVALLLLLLLLVLQSVRAGKFWHITDIHYDAQYIPGSDPTSMCHNITTEQATRASAFGNYLCDSPLPLVESAFDYMVKINPNPDFILWTGDDPPHVLVNYTMEETLFYVQNITNFIRKYFPKTRIFPGIGNHDWYLAHQVDVGPNAYYAQIAQWWAPWLSAAALETFSVAGYYTEVISPGYRIVSLNTVFYYHLDNATRDMVDPGGQLAWINTTLTAARDNGERVYLIAHVPPGFLEKQAHEANMYFAPNDVYLEALAPFSDVIIAHFYGHEHTDALRFFTSNGQLNETVPTNVMFLSPSVTPWLNPLYVYVPTNNPAVRMFEFDDRNYEIADFYTYWTNVSANAASGQIDWMLEYVASEVYTDLPSYFSDPRSLLALSERFSTNETLLQQYISFNSILYPQTCDKFCAHTQLCALRAPWVQQYIACQLVPPAERSTLYIS